MALIYGKCIPFGAKTNPAQRMQILQVSIIFWTTFQMLYNFSCSDSKIHRLTNIIMCGLSMSTQYSMVILLII